MNQQNFIPLQQIQQPEINQTQMNGQQLAAQQQIIQQQIQQQNDQDTIGDILNEINTQEQPNQQYIQQNYQNQYMNEGMIMNKMYDMNDIKEKGIKYLKKVIMIVIIYLIISSQQFKNITSKYINILKPDENGNIKITGSIIYGIILAALIILSNEFILNKNI